MSWWQQGIYCLEVLAQYSSTSKGESYMAKLMTYTLGLSSYVFFRNRPNPTAGWTASTLRTAGKRKTRTRSSWNPILRSRLASGNSSPMSQKKTTNETRADNFWVIFWVAFRFFSLFELLLRFPLISNPDLLLICLLENQVQFFIYRNICFVCELLSVI